MVKVKGQSAKVATKDRVKKIGKDKWSRVAAREEKEKTQGKKQITSGPGGGVETFA